MPSNTFDAKIQVPATDPKLLDLLDLVKKDIFLSMYCHAIATITDFDPATQTASATMVYKKTFVARQVDGTYTPQLRDYPPLTGCPVIFPGGVDSYLTFPDVVGSTAWVMFNDRDLDNWYANTGAQLASSRLHSFSDAVLLLQPRSRDKALANFDSDRAVLGKGNAMVGVGKDNELIKIANEAYTLNGLLQDLITAIKAITVSPGSFSAGGDPVLGSSGTPANAATFTTIADQLSDLLE